MAIVSTRSLAIQLRTHVLVDALFREELEEFEFSESAKAKEGVFERKDFLDRHFPPRRLVDSSSHCSVSAFAQSVEDAIVFACRQTTCSAASTRRGVAGQGWVSIPLAKRWEVMGVLTDVELGKRLGSFARHGLCERRDKFRTS